MKISNELLDKAKKASSKEELAKVFESEKLDASNKDIENVFNYLHRNGELQDAELRAVSAGSKEASCDTSSESYKKYSVGDRVAFYDLKSVYMGAMHVDLKGVITSVSDSREGDSRLEWVYTIRTDDGYSTEVYEHQITSKI